MSQHLGMLVAAGVLSVRRDGRHRRYALRPSALAEVTDWLTHSEVLPEPAGESAMGWHVMLDALALACADRSTDGAWASIDDIAPLYAG